MKAYGGARLERWFRPLLAALAVCMTMLQIASVRGDAPTWDEGLEVSSGYSYLRSGEYRILPEHPPLARVVAALPLLWVNPSARLDDPSWKAGAGLEFGQAFLYRNRVPADQILFAARLPGIALAVLLVITVAVWVRSCFNAAAGLLAGVLLAFDPNILANGRYTKNDVPVALLCFLAATLWARYADRGGWRWLLSAGAAFGLAVMTKFSAVFLIPTFGLLWIAAKWRNRAPMAPVRGFLSLALAAAMVIPAVALAYAPEWRKLRPATRAYRSEHPEARRLRDSIVPDGPAATRFADVCQQMGLQDHSFLKGLTVFLGHTTGGHHAYLLGRLSDSGWWYYFPVAFLVKTPVASLTLLALALWLFARRAVDGLRGLRIEWWVCAIPTVIYWAVTLGNKVDIGLRHVLPVYPFLWAGVAAAVVSSAWRWRDRLLPTLAIALAAESTAIFPHYLSFFNIAAGGPSAGPHYLLDSNIDWGQDLLRLRDYWRSQGQPKLCLLYFGSAPPEYYGMHADEVPRTNELELRRTANCLAAVSVTPLYDLYLTPGEMAWLRERKPDAKIGYSIYIYDLRKPVALSRLLPRSPGFDFLLLRDSLPGQVRAAHTAVSGSQLEVDRAIRIASSRPLQNRRRLLGAPHFQ